MRIERPRIHILDGENVCIHSTRPAHVAEELASSQTFRISSGVVASVLKADLVRDALRGGERLGDLGRVVGDLLERARAVEVLRAGDEPDFRGGGS